MKNLKELAQEIRTLDRPLGYGQLAYEDTKTGKEEYCALGFILKSCGGNPWTTRLLREAAVEIDRLGGPDLLQDVRGRDFGFEGGAKVHPAFRWIVWKNDTTSGEVRNQRVAELLERMAESEER